eukprot:14976746-Ditylum_brightwellii.AAC.1
MVYPTGLGSLVAVHHELTGAWYPALIIAEGWGSDGSFYHIVWLDVPCGVTNTKAIVSRD